MSNIKSSPPAVLVDTFPPRPVEWVWAVSRSKHGLRTELFRAPLGSGPLGASLCDDWLNVHLQTEKSNLTRMQALTTGGGYTIGLVPVVVGNLLAEACPQPADESW
jgi:hypothetical protein